MRGLVSRLQTLLVFGVVAALLIVTGSGFLIAALHLELVTTAGATAAALITGAVCLAVGGLVVLIGWLVLRSAARRQRRDRKPPDAVKTALAVGETLGGDLQGLARRHRYAMIGAALAAGFAVGVSPRLRRALRSLLDG